MSMLYHICNATDWQDAQQKGYYAAESLHTEGFIHFSKQNQVLATAQLFYKGQQGLVLLCINPAKLEAEVIYENTMGGEELFPHLYGQLNISAVERVADFFPDDQGNFSLPS